MQSYWEEYNSIRLYPLSNIDETAAPPPKNDDFDYKLFIYYYI